MLFIDLLDEEAREEMRPSNASFAEYLTFPRDSAIEQKVAAKQQMGGSHV